MTTEHQDCVDRVMDKLAALKRVMGAVRYATKDEIESA